MALQKRSDGTLKGSNLSATDLIRCSVDAGGGSWNERVLTGADILNAVQGLIDSVVTNNILNTVSDKSADYSFDPDNDWHIRMDATSGNKTINLPSAGSCQGVTACFSKSDSSGNTVTIDPNGAQTINGASNYVLSTQYKTITLQSISSTEWQILSIN